MERNSLTLPYGVPVEDHHGDFLHGHKTSASASSSQLKWLLIDNLTKLTVRPLGYSASKRKRGGDAKQQLQESADVSEKGKEKIAEEDAMETDLYDMKEAAPDTKAPTMLPLEGLSLTSATMPLARLQGFAMLPYLRALQLTHESYQDNSRFILGEAFEPPNPLPDEEKADDESEDSADEEAEEVKARPPTSASLFSMPPTLAASTMPTFSFPPVPSPFPPSSFGGAGSFFFATTPTPASRKPISIRKLKQPPAMRQSFGDAATSQPEQTAVFWLPRLEVLRLVAQSSPIKASIHEGASPRLKVLIVDTLMGLSEILPSPTGRLYSPPLSPMVELSTRYK